MEVTISSNLLIQAAALLGALGSIGAVVVWCIKFVERQKKQDKELAAIRSENCLLCWGLSACLDGLEQLGCNHSVPEIKAKLDKHLNQEAHRGEANG